MDSAPGGLHGHFVRDFDVCARDDELRVQPLHLGLFALGRGKVELLLIAQLLAQLPEVRLERHWISEALPEAVTSAGFGHFLKQVLACVLRPPRSGQGGLDPPNRTRRRQGRREPNR